MLPEGEALPAERDDLPGDPLRFVAGEVGEERSDVFGGAHRAAGLHFADVELFLPGDAGDHAGEGRGQHAVDVDAVARKLDRHRVGHRGDAALGAGVVGLAKVALLRDGGDGDDGAEALLAHSAGRGASEIEGAVEVDVDHALPLLVAHVDERAITQDARGGDREVDLAVGVEAGLHDAVAGVGIGNVGLEGRRFAACGLDFVDLELSDGGIGAGAVDIDAEVGDNDLRAFRGEEVRRRTRDAPSGS